MVELLDDQKEATAGWRRWVDALLRTGKATEYGWIVEGAGIVFSNYGHAEAGEVGDQVMLGVDPEFGSGIVKIVRPVVSGGAKRKLTLIGRDDRGRLKLLREGRLHKNALSRLVRDDFATLSGLTETPVSVGGHRSDRHWYVVADLDEDDAGIVAQTVRFANACTRARARAGGGKVREPSNSPSYGMDEKGGIMTVTRKGGTAEVVRLQGHVFEQLKRKVGPTLRKPSKDAFCVDGMIEPANLLIEIKTGVSPHDIYEAVGQLQLYPSLVGLPSDVSRLLLVPDEPPIKPNMSAALQDADVEVFTYTVAHGRKAPRITFPAALLARCRQRRVP